MTGGWIAKGIVEKGAGLPRHFVPRNDEVYWIAALRLAMTRSDGHIVGSLRLIRPTRLHLLAMTMSCCREAVAHIFLICFSSLSCA